MSMEEIAKLRAFVAEADERNWIMGKEQFMNRMPHHNGIEALWVTKWKQPCSKSVYPFHDGAYKDFEPIFQYLIKEKINDEWSPNYTAAFTCKAEDLEKQGDTEAAMGNEPRASTLYLRACALYRIARFPYVSRLTKEDNNLKWAAWESQKRAYLKAGALWDEPLQEVFVQHTHRKGMDLDTIPIYVRVPEANKRVPVVILMTGLDGYRPDNTERCEEFLKRGWASVVVEIPGTADCPADRADPESPDRLWTSLLIWMTKDRRLDMRRVMVWGLSSGGYYAIRIAHTHKDQLIGSVAQGAGCHYFFDREWLDKVDGHEYPFFLTRLLAKKHGFDSVDEFKAKAQKKFSLLETGILKKPSTRLLLVNGTSDGLMPIEDSMLLFEHGRPKEARFFRGVQHMGYPMANASVYPWMEEVMASVRA